MAARLTDDPGLTEAGRQRLQKAITIAKWDDGIVYERVARLPPPRNMRGCSPRIPRARKSAFPPSPDAQRYLSIGPYFSASSYE
jgi:hypothetical protein